MEAQLLITFAGLKDAFSEQLKAFIVKSAGTFSRNHLCRLEIHIQDCDPLTWLKNQPHPAKIYWANRDLDLVVAAVGHADLVKGKERSSPTDVLKTLNKKISPQFSAVRYYGGFCFDPQNISTVWKSFGAYYFTAPRFEIVKTPSKVIFACNLHANEVDMKYYSRIMEEFNGLSFTASVSKGKTPKLKSSKDHPDSRKWQGIVSRQIAKIKNETIRKVVLARQSVLEFSEAVNAANVLKQLKDISTDCYYFYFQVDPAAVFLGASPERLFRRQGLNLLTEALAGTRPRGKSLKEDQKFKEALLNSEKDWHEHQLVTDWIRNILSPMCTQFQTDSAFSILSLKGGHHLITRMKGKLLETVDDASLLERLHPTPAVAGWPKEKSLEIIREVEPFSRGYYAAPVGYVGYDEAEFAVAIRSGLIQKNKVTLYAGSGIVHASKATEEWEEAGNKLQIFLKALGL